MNGLAHNIQPEEVLASLSAIGKDPTLADVDEVMAQIGDKVITPALPREEELNRLVANAVGKTLSKDDVLALHQEMQTFKVSSPRLLIVKELLASAPWAVSDSGKVTTQYEKLFFTAQMAKNFFFDQMKKEHVTGLNHHLVGNVSLDKSGKKYSEWYGVVWQEPDAPAPDLRRYHVVAINEKTGDSTRMTSSAVTHAEGTTMLGKFTPHPERRLQLEEVPTVVVLFDKLETRCSSEEDQKAWDRLMALHHPLCEELAKQPPNTIARISDFEAFWLSKVHNGDGVALLWTQNGNYTNDLNEFVHGAGSLSWEDMYGADSDDINEWCDRIDTFLADPVFERFDKPIPVPELIDARFYTESRVFEGYTDPAKKLELARTNPSRDRDVAP